METRRQRLSQRRKAAEHSAILRSPSELRQDTAEAADLFRPQPAVTTPPDPAELAHPIGSEATVDIPTTPRRVKRFAILGALTVVGVAGSLALVTPHHAPVAVIDTGSEVPVAVFPASDFGGSAGMPDQDHPAPVTATVKNAEAAIPAAPAVAPKPRDTRNLSRAATAHQPKPEARAVTPEPDRRASAAEAYVRSRAAELSEYEQRWRHLTAPRP